MGVPAVVALGGAGAEADEDLPALSSDAPRAKDRLALRGTVVLEEAGVTEQVVELVLGQAPLLPELELVDRHLADPAHSRLRERRLLAQRLPNVASTSRVESPRTKLAITSDSSALVLVTPSPSSREANGSGFPRSFGRSRVIGPEVVFTVTGA